MILIGETIINEDVATELREAVASRIEELKKAVKAMEKVKLDPAEPEGKIDVLRTLDRLMDPQADWEAQEEMAGRQKDVSEVQGWNERTERIEREADALAEPEQVISDAHYEDDGRRFYVQPYEAEGKGVLYNVVDRESGFVVGQGLAQGEAEEMAEENNDFVASLSSVHDTDAAPDTPPLPEEPEEEPEGMVLTDPFAEPEEEGEEERDELADARKRELQNALLEEMGFEPEPTEEAGDEDAVQPAPEGPYYVEKVDAGFFQVRTTEAVRCTRNTLPDAEAARDRLNRQAVATEAPATL